MVSDFYKKIGEPKISLIMPVYNVEGYLLDTLESISKQTYTNIEVIAIDDGSSDNSFKVLKEYSSIDRRFRVFKNSNNKGISITLNKAISLSTGEFIARVDGDDIMDKDRLLLQLRDLVDGKADIVGCSLITINEYGKELGRVKYPSCQKNIKKLLKFTNPIAHVWLCKKGIYQDVGNYRFDGVEDLDFIQRASKQGYIISNVNNYYGMRIRIRGGNTSELKGLEQRVMHKRVIMLSAGSIETLGGISLSKLRVRLYQLSCIMVQKAFVSSFFLRRLYYFCAILISPDQLMYLIERYKKKKLMK